MKTGLFARLIAGALLLGAGCSREIPNPAQPVTIDVDVPPTPVGLNVLVGDRLAELSWSVDDTSNLTFRIYIAHFDSQSAVYSLAGESSAANFIKTDLHNSDTYFFKVSAVDETGFEGYKSDSVSAVPNSYGFVINGGADYCSGRDVILSVFAPLGTSLMQFSEDSSFTGAAWENFISSRNFRLSPGDGAKTVFGRFRDSGGRITAGPISDAISLDSFSAIDSFLFSPSGTPFAPGDMIRFSLYAGEPDGSASVTIGNEIITVELRDDGSGGDQVPGDGIYERDYIVAPSLDFESQLVYGDFIDRVENEAARATAAQTMSVRRPPDPVAIYSIIVPQGYYNRLQLAWNAATAPDFAQYRLYRSQTSGVDSTAFLVSALTSRTATTATDTGLVENSTYFYRVYVIDNTGLWAGSNEVSGTCGQDDPPAPVTLYAPFPTPGSHDRLELSWSSSGENDFLRYELYRSDDSNVDSLDNLVFSSPSQTSHVDTGLEADSLYYYAVVARDVNGNASWSNTASGRTNADLPPERVTLFPLIIQPDYYQNVEVDWSESSEDDFESYRLYRWREDLTRADSQLVALVSESGVTSFADNPPFNVAGDTVNYWYILHLYDRGGNSAPSDSVRAHLVDNPPGTVSGSVMPSSSSLIVSWNLSEIPDFGSYVLLRDTDSDPAGAITVFVTSDRETGSFDDDTANQGTVYFYWLDIYDRRDNSSRSPLGSGSW